MLFSKRSCESIFHGPMLSIQSLNQSGLAYSDNVSPFSYRVAFPIVLNFREILFIPCLLCVCGPSAVIRGIALVRVNAINGEVFGVTIRHSPLIEWSKTVFVIPFRTYLYAFAAVTMVVFVGWIITSITHGFPYSVYARACHTVFTPIVAAFPDLIVQASTGFCGRVFLCNRAFFNDFFCATVAPEEPKCMIGACSSDIFNCSKSIELLTSYIFHIPFTPLNLSLPNGLSTVNKGVMI